MPETTRQLLHEHYAAFNAADPRLAAGAFFEVRDGSVARVSNPHKLENGLRQLGAER